MGLQFEDPFDTYGNNYNLTAGYPWDTVQTNVVRTTDFRFAPPAGLPGGCVELPATSLRKNLLSNQSTLIFGYGIKFLALPSGANVNSSLYFFDTGKFQMGLYCNSNGQLQFWAGNGQAPGGGGFSKTTPLGSLTASNTVIANTWYGFRGQVTIANGSAGAASLYINGSSSPTINLTGLNTAPSGNAYATQCNLGDVDGAVNQRFDDFFLWDTTGSTQNSLPTTDSRILSKVGNSAGFYTNWTPNGLGSNWQNVSNMPPIVGDYNANNVGGTKDSYTLPSAGLTVAPLSVVVRASLWKDDGATHTPSLMVRSGSTDGVGAALPAIPASPAFNDTLFPTDPATTVAWTAAGADAAQIGIVEG